jgi:isopenicillin-N N-acyltransferase-like protein
MKWFKLFIKITLYALGVILIGLVCLVTYIYQNSTFSHPLVSASVYDTIERTSINDSTYVLGNNWIAKNEFGHFVMYTEGAPYERGIVNGKLSRELIVRQEEAFTEQIQKMIPSDKYLKFLKYIIGFVNRNLPNHVVDEYKQEIYGIAQASSDSFDWIGDKYTRQLNYHAAHDIGHALQNMMLVGCTSFGTWGNKTQDGKMLIGRNFDFWVGDAFAENKVISFVKPDSGYAFGFVTWGAFIGVSSGMNEKGLTVTINAAKSSIPYGAATPVSLVAREILQYAEGLDEAIRIAKSRKMFVSESFLVASTKDKKAIVIEKTPKVLDIYDPHSDHIYCANHFQSEKLGNDLLNLEQKAKSASVYRYERLSQLLDTLVLTPMRVADVLRDIKGINNVDIGLGNEKAINQLIAHHSVIFQPEDLLMWVSTSPWQMGAFVCYDFKKIFNSNLSEKTNIINYALNIPADSAFLKSDEFQNYLIYKSQRDQFNFGNKSLVSPETIVKSNSNLYDAYRIAGDYFVLKKDYIQAIDMYMQALQKEIATEYESEQINKKILEVENKLKKN